MSCDIFSKLSAKQVKKLRKHLDRVGEGDIKIGHCRQVAKGVEVCRVSRHGYRRTSKRCVPKSAWG